MRSRLWAALPVIGALLAVASMPTPADALARRLRSNYEPGEIITARSHYGNGSVQSVVRPGRYGWQVKLPRGGWVDCRRSCGETLRVQTVPTRYRTADTARWHANAACSDAYTGNGRSRASPLSVESRNLGSALGLCFAALLIGKTGSTAIP